MGKKTGIKWTDHTANPWWGCTKITRGCKFCYAAADSERYGWDIWGNRRARRKIMSFWKLLSKLQKDAQNANIMVRVFIGSMMDIFEDSRPMIDQKGGILTEQTGDIRALLFAAITAGKYPNLDFLFLTKRPQNINLYIPSEWKQNPPDNVMFGTSIFDQASADKFIPELLKVNGLRFLSIEPQVDWITLMPWLAVKGNIHWVINGG